ncbi:MAG: outer membrane protein assembly factor BamE [Nitrososphaera sp.]|nr:outer membrane protein assembly factor BamE [Nitrososphaera sp.]
MKTSIIEIMGLAVLMGLTFSIEATAAETKIRTEAELTTATQELRLGMSKDQVQKLLGTPDAEDKTVPAQMISKEQTKQSGTLLDQGWRYYARTTTGAKQTDRYLYLVFNVRDELTHVIPVNLSVPTP